MKVVEEKPQKFNKLTPFCNLDHFITVEKNSVVVKWYSLFEQCVNSEILS